MWRGITGWRGRRGARFLRPIVARGLALGTPARVFLAVAFTRPGVLRRLLLLFGIGALRRRFAARRLGRTTGLLGLLLRGPRLRIDRHRRFACRLPLMRRGGIDPLLVGALGLLLALGPRLFFLRGTALLLGALLLVRAHLQVALQVVRLEPDAQDFVIRQVLVPPHAIETVVHEKAAREAAESLIGTARERAQGVGDNLSVAIVKLEKPDPQPPGLRTTTR